jgi:hypothetical protein
MWWLEHRVRARPEKLAEIVDATWSELAAHAPSGSARRAVKRLAGWSDAVKGTLHTRLHRSNTMTFIRQSS